MNKKLITTSLTAAALVLAATPAMAAPNWGKAPSKKVVLFYAGTASLEWTLKGTEHGGAKAVRTNETCASCHDGEAADIGKKIVTGGKPELEKAAIKGKATSIPLTVQATHDGTNLYVRMQWKDTKAATGKKSDAANQVKAAMMIDAGNVEYAKEGSCWATCHHDLRTMPDADKGAAAKVKSIAALADGPTKYLKESRTSITNKEHPWGGWDKVKSDADVAAALKAGQFLDLVQFRSGGAPREGYVLESRHLKDAPGVAEGKLEGDTWTVTFVRKLAGGATSHKLAAGKTYNVGFAIHDDYSDGRYHHVSVNYTLGLDASGVDINAVKQ